MRGERRRIALDVRTPDTAERGVFEGVLDGVRSSISAWLGDVMDLVERIDLLTLLVTGRWLGVGRVGVLNGAP